EAATRPRKRKKYGKATTRAIAPAPTEKISRVMTWTRNASRDTSKRLAGRLQQIKGVRHQREERGGGPVVDELARPGKERLQLSAPHQVAGHRQGPGESPVV